MSLKWSWQDLMGRARLWCLAAFTSLLHGVAATSCTTEVHVGMSLTLDPGTLSPYVVDDKACYYCPDALRAIELWRDTINNGDFVTSEGCKLTIRFTWVDDGGSTSGGGRNVWIAYRLLHQQGVDVFIGPAFPELNEAAARAVGGWGKVMITWSLVPRETWRRSRTGELAPVNLTMFENSFATADILGFEVTSLLVSEEVYGTDCPYCLEESSATSTASRRLTAPPPKPAPVPSSDSGEVQDFLYEVTVEPLADWAAFYDAELNNTFDVNIPPELWAVDALRLAYDNAMLKARNFVFLSYASSYRTQCQGARQVVNQWDHTKTTLVDADYLDILEKMKYIRTLAPDAMLMCGDANGIVIASLVQKALSYSPRVIVISEPGGKDLVKRLFGYNVNGFMEPLPLPPPIRTNADLAFGTLGRFLDTFTSTTNHEPRVGALQLAAAGSLLTAAIRKAPLAELSRTLRESTIETLLGNYSFDSIGKRRVYDSNGLPLFPGLTASRQFAPYPDDDESQRLGFDPMDRYQDSQVRIVHAAARATCPDYVEYDLYATHEDHTKYASYCQAQFVDNTSLMESWIDKEVAVFPCRPGCYVENLDCAACSPGTFRSSQDLNCRPCVEGEYAEWAGMGACRACESGAVCNDPAGLPSPRRGFYRVTALPSLESLWSRHTWLQDILEKLNVTIPLGTTELEMSTTELMAYINKTISSLSMSSMTVDEFMSLLDNATVSTALGCEVIEPLQSNYSFILCEPASVCLGGEGESWGSLPAGSACLGVNKGILCGQCPDGYTYHTWKVAYRECITCDQGTVGTILTDLEMGFGLLAFMLLIFWMSWVTDAAVKKPYLPVGVLRLTVHYVFLLAAALENSTLDAKINYVLMIPLNFLYRPFDLFKMACILGVQQEELIRFEWEVAALVLPVGVVVIVGGHIAIFLLSSLWVNVKYVGQICLWRFVGCFNHVATQVVEQTQDALDLGDVSGASGIAQAQQAQIRQERQRISKYGGPGDEDKLAKRATFRYVRMRQAHYLKRSTQTILREIFLWMLVTYPISVRGLSSALSCRDIGGGLGRRVVLDFSLECGSTRHEDLTEYAPSLLLIYLVGVPFIAYCTAVFTSGNFWNMWNRWTSVYLYEGLKPQAVVWEPICIIRLGLFIWAGKLASINQRCVNMIFVLTVSLIVYLLFLPYEPRDRQALHNLERLYTISIMGVITCGFVSHATQSQGETDGFHFNTWYTFTVFVLVCLLNLFALVYAVMVVYIHTISLQLQALIEDGASVDNFSRFLHGIICRFRGLNKVGYVEENGTHFMDVSYLNERERKFLVLSLTQTIRACMDSSNKFHTWLVEKALHEAFTRAVRSNSANLRALYDEFGTHPWSLFSANYLGKLIGPVVTMRPPDIQVDEPDTGAVPKVQYVSVEELHNALSSVDVDVIARHPGICRPVEVKAINQVNLKKKGPDLISWSQYQSLKVFEEDMEQHGALRYGKMPRERPPEDYDDHDVLAEMEAETEQHRKDRWKSEMEIERQLVQMQGEVNRLKEELRLVDPDALAELEKVHEAPEKQGAFNSLLEEYMPADSTASQRMAVMSILGSLPGEDGRAPQRTIRSEGSMNTTGSKGSRRHQKGHRKHHDHRANSAVTTESLQESALNDESSSDDSEVPSSSGS